VNDGAEVFNAFNAKYLPPEAIAATFIPPPQFDVLLRSGHTMLVGPRGTGKTTLLKMLLPRALTAWRHERADEVRRRVDFTSVLIPTDLTWRGQLDASLTPEDDRAVSEVGILAFTTHVLRAVALAGHERIHGPFDGQPFKQAAISPHDEARLAKAVGQAWRLDVPTESLRDLEMAMTDRMTSIGIWLQEAREASSYGESTPRRPDIPHLEYGSAARSLIERFNAEAAEDGARWALMFDELELAPSTVIQLLLRAMRGADELLLYKVSLAPYSDHGMQLRNALAASVSNDYQVEHLTHPHKEDGYRFARALLAARLGVEEAELDDSAVLGSSPFDTQADAWIESGSAYATDSPKLKRFRDAAKADPTFAAWLAQQNVDLVSPDLDPNRRAATLRKVTSVTLLRREFRTSDVQRKDYRHNRAQRGRDARTVPALYAGATSLYAMIEGNPRWFMNLIGPLADAYHHDGRKVDPAEQARAIARAGRRFRAVLKALPLPPTQLSRRPMGALPVLDAIGEYFYRRSVLEDFTADPPGSFVVDSDITDDIHFELTVALNAGAIIYMPEGDEEGGPIDDLRGLRFRLSYLLAPLYRIGLTTGRPVRLGAILAEQGPTRVSPNQLVLDVEDKSTS
jgi:hypothetical protein